ncbi:MAG: FGGY-family carbohydrate kinase [Spirochaetota bacterium]|uniref:FGGY-family carbohydrate kinase n=1 Tax=Candidatus Jordarchaeum sp. TaxID=2823881 RepID=UPI00404B6DA0
MPESYLIGVDLGTTLAKCAIYNNDCRVISEAQKEMEVGYPKPGWAEQDASDFYTITCELIRECVSKSGIDTKRVAALGIDSQMGGIMSIDKNFNPVTYYDTPLDSRSAGENRDMHERLGELILDKNGSISTYGNKILYWKKRREWRDIYKFVQPSAFVAGKLSGLTGDEVFIDESFLCFSGLSDLSRGEWSEELCIKLGVDMEKLPRIVKSTEIIGELTRKASEDTGLTPGIPICAGCGDQAAGFVGAGVVRAGQMADVSGTACILAACINSFTCDMKYKTLSCMKSAIGDKYYLMSVVLGGRTHRWFIDEFFSEEKARLEQNGVDVYSWLDDQASKLPPGSDGLIAIDYLQGRFFPPDPYIRGLFIGHTWAHKKIHFYRAILESIAYDHCLTLRIIKELLPDLDVKMVTAFGSGSKSRFWMQIKSDILQIPYQNLHRSDLATLGVALIAGYAAGVFRDIYKILDDFVDRKVRVDPAPGENRKYEKYIGVYGELFEALKGIYKRISS